MQKSELKIESRIWVVVNDNRIYLGEGRVSLLKEIDKFGSISKAAKEMKMSYKKAWGLVDSMNSQGKELLVVPKTGGKNGGGSVVSDHGKKAIELYTKIKKSNRAHLDRLSSKLKTEF